MGIFFLRFRLLTIHYCQAASRDFNQAEFPGDYTFPIVCNPLGSSNVGMMFANVGMMFANRSSKIVSTYFRLGIYSTRILTGTTVKSEQYSRNPVQIDIAKILDRLGGDRELLGDLIVIYREDYPQLLEEVSAAVGARDGAALQRVGHALKGLIGNFLHDGTTNLAFRLEKKGRSLEWDGIDDDVCQLTFAAGQLLNSLEQSMAIHE